MRRTAILALLAAFSTAAVLGAQVAADPLAGAPTREEQETMAEILVLQEEIGRLMRSLSPDLQDAVLARLEAMAVGLVGDAEAAALPPAIEAGERAIQPIAVPGDEVASDESLAPPPAIPTRGRLKVAPAGCNTLALFDSNDDGKVSANDRYWRHLYLWSDADGDQVMQESEVQSAYDRGVRSLDVRLDTFFRDEGDQTVPGEVEVDRFIVLDVGGDGFDSTAVMIDDGVLVVDAGKLSRGDGPDLMDETGLPLDGWQAFRSGLRLVLASGEGEALACP